MFQSEYNRLWQNVIKNYVVQKPLRPLLLMSAKNTREIVVDIQPILKIIVQPHDMIWYPPGQFMKVNIEINIHCHVYSKKDY